MTNLEFIRTCSEEKLAGILCSCSSTGEGACEFCIATDFCGYGNNGMSAYLEKDCDDEEYGIKTRL